MLRDVKKKRKRRLFNILQEGEITSKSNRREEPDPDNCGLMWNMLMEEGGRWGQRQ